MNVKSTFLKMSLVSLLLLFSRSAWSAVYYSCEGATYTFTYTPVAGEIATWNVVTVNGTAVGGFPAATPPTTLPVGEHRVILHVTSSAANGSCTSDPVENTIIVLPNFSVAVASPVAEYCENNTQTALLTATITSNAGNVPAGVTYEYNWYEAQSTTGNDVGSSPVLSSGAGNTYNIPAIATVGKHYFTAQVQYNITGATVAGTWIGTGCKPFAGTAHEIEVNPKPVAPTITISAN